MFPSKKILCYVAVSIIAIMLGQFLYDELFSPITDIARIENKADSIASLHKAQVDSLLRHSARQDSVIATYKEKAANLNKTATTRIEKADSLSILADTATLLEEKYQAKVQENEELRMAISDLQEALSTTDGALSLAISERDGLKLALESSVNKMQAVESLVKEAVSEARKSRRQLQFAKIGTVVGALVVVGVLTQ